MQIKRLYTIYVNIKLLIISILLLTLLITFKGCEKEKILPDPELGIIFCRWDWLFSEGGLGPVCLNPENQGYNKHIAFDKNGIYTEYQDDRLTIRANYKIVKRESRVWHDEFYIIEFDNDFLSNQVINDINDTLMLSDEAFDGLRHCYVKMN